MKKEEKKIWTSDIISSYFNKQATETLSNVTVETLREEQEEYQDSAFLKPTRPRSGGNEEKKDRKMRKS